MNTKLKTIILSFLFFVFGVLLFACNCSGSFLNFNSIFASAMVQDAVPQKTSMTEISLCLIPVILFNLFFGIDLYADFEVSGVYVFTRNLSRTKWYLKKTLRLFISSFLFCLLFFFAGATTLLMMKAEISSVQDSVKLFAAVVISYTLFCFLIALLTNILSIVFNSGYAFALTTGLLILMLAAVVIPNISISPEDYTFNTAFQLNFIANLAPSWHEFQSESLRAAQTIRNVPGFSYSFTLVYFLALCAAAFFAGFIIFKRAQVLSDTKENE